MSSTPSGLDQVRATLHKAAAASQRSAEDITLVAVSKTKSAQDILSVLDAGHRVFGENRVQEAEEKWPALKHRFSDVELHLIGPLQTNKVKSAVSLFDVIESVDREKLARRLAEECKKQGRSLNVFLQVNTGEEPQKAGVPPRY